MSSEVGSSLIMFIAAVGIAGLVAAGLTQALGDVALEVDDRGETLADAIGTDLAIVNDPENVPYDTEGNNVLTIYVKNTGSRTLSSSDLMLLVDGQHETFDERFLDGSAPWSPGTILEANVTVSLTDGDHRVRALYTPNIADDLEFRI